jgi:hypothetical protein
MCLELLKRILYCNKIFAIIVLLQDLFAKTMVDASLEDIGVIRRINLSTRASERGSVLAKKLNMFLRYVSRFLDTIMESA